MAAGVCQSGQAATKVNGEGVNFDSKDAFVSHLDVPGHPDLRIVVQIDGTGGPLTSIMKDKTTGLPLLHKSLESMALTGASAIHSHVVSSRIWCFGSQPHAGEAGGLLHLVCAISHLLPIVGYHSRCCS